MERIGLAPGSEIGGYTIVSPLGSGGMGAVYRAVDGGGDAVALKLLHPGIGSDAAARERLRREVAALQKLRHPAVAAVLDAEADSTEAFIVTELVDGDTLEQHVRARGALGADDLLALAAGLRGALAAVHAAGVVHRDLKPSNVLLTDHGPVLIDFGIAQAAGDSSLTSTGLVIGTPGYLAPELIDGGEPSAATDDWGWAAVLAFAATGRPPFGARPLEVVLARARSGEVDLDGLGSVTSAALRGALAADPAERTAPDDVVAALTVVAAEGETYDEPRAVDEPDEDGGEPAEDAATVVRPAPSNGRAKGAAAAGGAATVAVVAGDPAVTTALPNDGYTRALAADPPDAAEEPAPRYLPPNDKPEWPGDDPSFAENDPALAPEGVDWLREDLDASSVDGPDGSGYVRPPARRRWGTLLACAALVGTAGALYPGITLLVVGVLLVVVRAAGSTVEAMHQRRERLGVRRRDRARAVATSPWHLLRAIVGLVPSLLVGASVMVILVGVTWWLVGEGHWTIEGSPAGSAPTGTTAAYLVGGAVLVGVAVVWWGPLSAMTRTGARRVLAVVAPPRLGAFIAIVVLLGAAVLLWAQIRSGADIHWAPLPTPTVPGS
ncbi:serine/threonine-protein kinase [Cellulomonas alba]|uniref:Serine/threonine-protein kinase n=1 Tax=Cellulomonas alba TaxID=3053467 RepID=A0ABT7SIL8_9CELL|nr:serine/threonine-protein kinase [Cellulomonas alba]MDM7855407.1 serine/threonine-protein kinase [Cellulomonas alba]